MLFTLADQEKQRQQTGINLIASENYASSEVLKMAGSVLMNKYVEGGIGDRYYSGCEFVDAIEKETIHRFKNLFKAEHVNVQSHSGSQANFAVYFAALKSGDTILSMNLAAGGHLTHGHKVNLSGQLYNIIFYGVDKQTELIDYEDIERLADKHKPKLIIAGASSYSRIIDFEKFSNIAKKIDALFLADIAHIAGLVAADLHPSPVSHADFVTLTTQKTFRGPRGGVILCKKKFGRAIDKAVMPGIQGGSFMNMIAAKGVACHFAAQSEFKLYQKNVVENARVMAELFKQRGYKIISGGTDTHLFVIDVHAAGKTGKFVEELLECFGIFVNRNAIPFDTHAPLIASGIRIGTAAITTRGATKNDCEAIVELIDDIIKSEGKQLVVDEFAQRVKKIVSTWK